MSEDRPAVRLRHLCLDTNEVTIIRWLRDESIRTFECDFCDNIHSKLRSEGTPMPKPQEKAGQ